MRTCFKSVNRCNLHPQCDPVKGSGDDKTSEDELDCYEEYLRKKLISRQATFRCQSPHHNEDSVKANLSRGVVWIKAVPQDGVSECWKGVDEEPAPWYFKYIAPGKTETHFYFNFKLSNCLLCKAISQFPFENMIVFQLFLLPLFSSQHLPTQC